MVKKLIEISNPNDGKGMEKFVKCYSDLTGKNSYILTCYLTLSQQAIFFTTSDILIELFYNVNISARIYPPLKQRTPLKS